MNRFILSLLLMLFGAGRMQAQLKTPSEFLGYELGYRFSSHEQVLDYFRYLGKQEGVRLQNYGKTYEGRDLLIAIVSSKENIDKLEEIRQSNLNLSKAKSALINKLPAILWLSYNVHGNEASSTETAMKMLYELTARKTKGLEDWLKNTIVNIDPCLNPDGRERYVNFFKEISGTKPNADPMAREHFEPWPGGRSNHYYFDLNRDWAWQTQVETQHRLKLYQEWMPQVHVDFHEQSYNEPYYFAPAAEPIHEDVTRWQREFQVIVGKNNAKYFDEKGWQYFTKERFDLLYPSYGDTYPLYNGSIGMTYEQGGIGAGLAVVTIDGDTLTLKDRIDHHFASGMATLETVSKHSTRLVEEFKAYFQHSVENPPGPYQTYVVKAQNRSRLKRLSTLLKNNGISFSYGGTEKSLRGYSFESKKMESFKLDRNDLVLNLHQPKAVLANVLFEPQTSIKDSNTYDITAWALPYAYGLKAYGLKESIKGTYGDIEKLEQSPLDTKPYAWIFPWNSIEDAQVLITLQNAKIKVRMAEEAFSSGGREFPSGSLLVYRTENEKLVNNLREQIAEIQQSFGVEVYTSAGGYVEKGKDFGSNVYPILRVSKVAMVSGMGISSQSVGEICHFFEQELKCPLTILAEHQLSTLDINKINVLILPDGVYADDINEKLSDWLKLGGKLILFEDAVAAVIGKKPFSVKLKDTLREEVKAEAKNYGARKQEDMSHAIPGAIFKVNLDVSHPLSAGLGPYYYALKTDDKVIDPLIKGWNVGVLKPGNYLAGVAGRSVIKRLDEGMLFGVQAIGKGRAVYVGNDILFRSFWESGKQIFANIVFLLN